MRVVAVDLAAKYSAAVTVTRGGIVLSQVDSWGRDDTGFLATITAEWSFGNPPAALVVEDLPHGVPYMTVTKQVCRLQGRLIDRMLGYGAGHALLWAAPIAWRTHFDLKRGSGAQAVVDTAAAHGYAPPDLSARVVGRGDKAIARKVATDYAAAYLIARWFIDAYHHAAETFDIPGITRQPT